MLEIEGLSPMEVLALDELEDLVVVGSPIDFSVGDARVLAEFDIRENTLLVTIAIVENGGAGVLPVLIGVIERGARQRSLAAIEWTILARNCAVPNPKLSRVLDRCGFEVRADRHGQEFYWRRQSTNQSIRDR